MAKPQFNASFTYGNIGNIIGKLTYVKPLQRKDGSIFGHDFLISVAGQGSVNVKVPMVSKSQQTVDEFPVFEKPQIKFNLTSVDAYFAQSGKWYLNLTTFNTGEAPKEGQQDQAIGRLSGEVAKYGTDKNGNITFLLVVYQTDKNNKLLVNRKTGKPFDPKVVPVTVTDDAIKAEFKKQGIKDGANIGIGYAFINKVDSGFDEFGFPTGSGQRVTQIQARKLVVYSVPEPEPQPDDFGLVEDEFVDPFADGTEVADPFADDFNDYPF